MTRSWIGAVAAFGLAACSVLPFGGGGGLPAEPERVPVFEMEAGVRLETPQQAALDIRMTPPTVRVLSRQPGSGSAVRVRWTVEILAIPSGQQLHEIWWVQTMSERDSTDHAEPIHRRFEVTPGDVLVAVTAEEEDTGVSFTARQAVSVPAPDAPLTILGMRLETLRGDGPWTPEIPRAVTIGFDSLRVLAQVLNGVGLDARVLIDRLEVDSSVAEPPFVLRRSTSLLVSQGVRLRSGIQDTLFARGQALDNEVVDVTVPMPRLRTGSYRIRVEADSVLRDRFLVVHRAGFPRIERVGDLVEAMRYIATDSEMRALTTRRDPFLQRRAFDRFWGDRIPDRRLAASTVRAYAERVEEANRSYSTQKEGWKTDPGMASILFGPPQRIERDPGRERWVYTSGPVSGLVLEFVATPERPEGWPYEVWVLRRGPAYEVAWERARRAWRRGDMP